MIDTTDAKAIELALTYCQGKSLINSINLEDGEEKFASVAPAGAQLRRRAGGRLHRRRPAPGPGVHARAQARRRRAEPRAADGEVRHSCRGHRLRPAGVSLRHRRRELHRRRRRDDRRRPADQGEAPAREDGARHLEHLVRPARRGPRGGQLGLPLSTAPRPGSTWRSSTRRSSSASPARSRTSGVWPRTCCSTGRSKRRARGLAPAVARAESRHQPAAHRGHRRAFPRRGEEGGEVDRPSCRSISAWPTTSSKAARTGSSRTSTASGPRAPARSTSSTGR